MSKTFSDILLEDGAVYKIDYANGNIRKMAQVEMPKNILKQQIDKLEKQLESIGTKVAEVKNDKVMIEAVRYEVLESIGAQVIEAKSTVLQLKENLHKTF